VYQAPWGDEEHQLAHGVAITSIAVDAPHDAVAILDGEHQRVATLGADGSLSTFAVLAPGSGAADLVVADDAGAILVTGFRFDGRELRLTVQELGVDGASRPLLDGPVDRLTVVNWPMLWDPTTRTLWHHDAEGRAIPMASLDPPRVLPRTTTLPWLGARVIVSEDRAEFVITMGAAELRLRAPARVIDVREVVAGSDGAIWFVAGTEPTEERSGYLLVRVDPATWTATALALPSGPFFDSTSWYAVEGSEAYVLIGDPQVATVLRVTPG
jgi:hypothetical protein